MTEVRGDKNSWQVGFGRMGEQEHIVAKCGSHTGHALNAVAFCDSRETAEVLVGALVILQHVHEHGIMGNTVRIRELLERAGLL